MGSPHSKVQPRQPRLSPSHYPEFSWNKLSESEIAHHLGWESLVFVSGCSYWNVRSHENYDGVSQAGKWTCRENNTGSQNPEQSDRLETSKLLKFTLRRKHSWPVELLPKHVCVCHKHPSQFPDLLPVSTLTYHTYCSCVQFAVQWWIISINASATFTFSSNEVL